MSPAVQESVSHQRGFGIQLFAIGLLINLFYLAVRVSFDVRPSESPWNNGHEI